MKILILDKDTDYSQRLKYYFGKKYSHFQFAVCDNIEDAKRMMAEDYFDVVLFDAEFDQIQPEEIGSLISRSAFAYISATNEIVNECDTLEKYVGISVLYSKICSLYEKKRNRVIKQDDSISADGKKTELIVFLPVHGGSGCSTMAAACAASLAAKHRVLYVDLEQCPSDSAFFDEGGKRSVSDIISTLKTKYTETGLVKTIRDAVQESTLGNANVSYIKGYTNILDCLSMSEQCIGAFLGALKEKFDYRYVIIDADFIVSKTLDKLVTMSDRVILVASGSDVANVKLSKIQRYLEILKRSAEEDMPERHLLLNMYRGAGSEMNDVRDMDILGRVPYYRANDLSKLTSRDVIKEMLAGRDVFAKLVPASAEAQA